MQGEGWQEPGALGPLLVRGSWRGSRSCVLVGAPRRREEAGSRVGPALPWAAQRPPGTRVGALSRRTRPLPEQEEEEGLWLWVLGGDRKSLGGGTASGGGQAGPEVCVEPLGSPAPQHDSQNSEGATYA